MINFSVYKLWKKIFIKYVKRFSEIGLNPAEFLTHKKEAQKYLGYKSEYSLERGIKKYLSFLETIKFND